MKLFFRQYGESGPPLVILHGLFGSGDNWIMIARQLAETHRVFLPDQRNHGRSPWSTDFSYQEMANDLLVFLSKHAGGQAHVVGHSMGGKTAMHAALINPEAFASLMVVDIAPRAYPVHHHGILHTLRSMPLNLENRTQADQFLSTGIPDAGTRQFLMKSLEKDEQGLFRWRMNLDVLSSKIEEVGKALPHDEPVHTHTLFVRGAQSDYIRDSDLFDIRKQFVYSRVVTIERAGHWVQAEQPEAFTALLKEWLE